VNEGSGTYGVRNPFTGKHKPRTVINYFVYLDSRKPDATAVLGQDPRYQDVLAQVQAFTLGGLTVYAYAEGADRFEAEVYSTHTPGYTLDRTQLIPVAKQNDDAPLTLYGRLSGALRPRPAPLTVERELHMTGFGQDDEGNQYVLLIHPDGSIEHVKAKELGYKW
jgi:hypothetical protein